MFFFIFLVQNQMTTMMTSSPWNHPLEINEQSNITEENRLEENILEIAWSLTPFLMP